MSNRMPAAMSDQVPDRVRNRAPERNQIKFQKEGQNTCQPGCQIDRMSDKIQIYSDRM